MPDGSKGLQTIYFLQVLKTGVEDFQGGILSHFVKIVFSLRPDKVQGGILSHFVPHVVFP